MRIILVFQQKSFFALFISYYFNIDGVDWVYEAIFEEEKLEFNLENAIIGRGKLSKGVVEHLSWNHKSDDLMVSFSTATSPTQIYRIKKKRNKVRRLTNEKVLAIPNDLLSPGDDASFKSYDGLQISARLYTPSESLNFVMIEFLCHSPRSSCFSTK